MTDSSAGKAAQLTVLLVILALSVALYTLPDHGAATPQNTTASSPTAPPANSTPSTATSPPGDRRMEETAPPATRAPCKPLLEVRLANATRTGSEAAITIEATLPNPCHKLTITSARAAGSEVVVEATIEQTQAICIQSLQETRITVEIANLDPQQEYTITLQVTTEDGTCKTTLGQLPPASGQ